MGWFSCFNPRRKDIRNYDEDTTLQSPLSARWKRKAKGDGTEQRKENAKEKMDRSDGNDALRYTFKELAFATQNFRETNIVGKGGFGCVYKGLLDSGKVIAVKRLDLKGIQGKQEFLAEVLMLCMLHHPYLVSLLGYCNDGDQRLLVYEYMPMGSLDKHLYDLGPGMVPLSWSTRLKIAIGAARGLEYLHNKVDPPVIYRDLKSANILLDEEYNPKLSDFGLARLGPVGGKTHVSTRVMGTYGYCAPDYLTSGKLTAKSDVYSFGVVFLELITGRKAIDYSLRREEQNLTEWARPWLKGRKGYKGLVDPLLGKQFPKLAMKQAVSLTAMCLQEQAKCRPLISDIILALDHIASQPIIDSEPQSCASSPLQPQRNCSLATILSRK